MATRPQHPGESDAAYAQRLQSEGNLTPEEQRIVSTTTYDQQQPNETPEQFAARRAQIEGEQRGDVGLGGLGLTPAGGVGQVVQPIAHSIDQNLLGGAERDANKAAADKMRSLGDAYDVGAKAVADKSQDILKPWMSLGADISGRELNTPSNQESLAGTGSGLMQGAAENAISQTSGPGYSEQLYKERQGGGLDPYSQRQLELGQRKIGDAAAAYGSTRGGATTEAYGNLTKDVLADQYKRMDALAGASDTGMNNRLRTSLSAAGGNEDILSGRAAGADAGRMGRYGLSLSALGDPTQYSAGLNTMTGLAGLEGKTNLETSAIGGDTASRIAGPNAVKDWIKAAAAAAGAASLHGKVGG